MLKAVKLLLGELSKHADPFVVSQAEAALTGLQEPGLPSHDVLKKIVEDVVAVVAKDLVEAAVADVVDAKLEAFKATLVAEAFKPVDDAKAKSAKPSKGTAE